MGKNNAFGQWCQNTWISTCKIIKLDSYLLSYTKVIQWTNDLNVRAKTTKPSEEVGKSHDIGFGNDFLDMVPKARERRGKLDTQPKLITLELQRLP